MLPAEMMNDREKPIRIRIGKPISVKAMDEMETIEELGEFLKRKVYMMKSYYEKRKSCPKHQSSESFCKISFTERGKYCSEHH
jgi:DNA helicase IV